MDPILREALVASLELERRVMAVAGDARLDARERGQRIRALTADSEARGSSLSDAWVAAGRPAPLGFLYNAHADHAEWFDGWVEVEAVLLDGEARGHGRDELERMILDGRPPFDAEFEAEELGIIYRRNDDPPEG